uniref:LysM domain-containing protein n=1 Tax=Kalanchoe fedtschenkoi TaxID=63787 RepID=A0A7N0TIS4_KALFE
MAKFSNRAALMFNLALMVTLLLTVTMVESRFNTNTVAPEQKATGPVCATIYGAQAGDSCFSITKFFGISMEFFSELNPNLVCEKIFVGEWLCISGSP